MSFHCDRAFKLWDFNVSHKQLLFRSPKSGDLPHNVDVVFWDVNYVEAATSFDSMSLSRLPPEQVRKVWADRSADLLSSAFFEVKSRMGVFMIVASGCKVLENDLDIFESSLVYFNRDRNLGEYGRILWRCPEMIGVPRQAV